MKSVLTSLAVASLASSASATQLVYEPFDASWTAGSTWYDVQGSAVTATNSSEVPPTALRINDAAVVGQFKAIEIRDPFVLASGIDITLKTAQFKNPVGGIGDGIAFYLRNGAEPTYAIGAQGGSLAYAPNGNTGLQGGLLGVGFDSAGYFSHSMQDPGGADNFCNPGNVAIAAPRPNTIGVRGGMNGTAFSGYCLLGYQTLPSHLIYSAGADTRAGRGRTIRVRIDPPGSPTTSVRVWVGLVDTPIDQLTSALNLTLGANWAKGIPSARIGFAGANGGSPNLADKDIWDLRIGSVNTINALDVSFPALPTGAVGSAYSSSPIVPLAGSAPYVLSVIGSLPPGLSYSNYALTGTPTAEGSFSFIARVNDTLNPVPSSARFKERSYTVRIRTAPLTSSAFTLEVPFLSSRNDRPTGNHLVGVIRAVYCDAAAALALSNSSLSITSVGLWDNTAQAHVTTTASDITGADFMGDGVSDKVCAFLRTSQAVGAFGTVSSNITNTNSRRLTVAGTVPWIELQVTASVRAAESAGFIAAAAAAGLTPAAYLQQQITSLRSASAASIYNALVASTTTWANPGVFAALFYALLASPVVAADATTEPNSAFVIGIFVAFGAVLAAVFIGICVWCSPAGATRRREDEKDLLHKRR